MVTPKSSRSGPGRLEPVSDRAFSRKGWDFPGLRAGPRLQRFRVTACDYSWSFSSLAIIVLIPFLIWGGRFEAAFSHDGTIAWLRDYGAWAWAAAILLLVLDLLLPVPATVVFSGLGFLYGAWLGGFIGAAGSILSGSGRIYRLPPDRSASSRPDRG